MTKLRAPLSIDAALARISGAFPDGWKEMARIVDRHESTVRAWGDEAKPEHIPLPKAIDLDVAFQKAGGTGSPLFEVYTHKLEMAREAAFSDQTDNARAACVVVKESSEAIGALINASLPSATPADEDEAIKQLEDLVLAAREPLCRLAAKRRKPVPP